MVRRYAIRALIALALLALLFWAVRTWGVTGILALLAAAVGGILRFLGVATKRKPGHRPRRGQLGGDPDDEAEEADERAGGDDHPRRRPRRPGF